LDQPIERETIMTTINGTGSSDNLSGGSGNDLIFGNSGDDSILGNAGVDSIPGGSGDDTIHGGTGDDVIGGDGPDAVYLPTGNGDEFKIKINDLPAGVTVLAYGQGEDDPDGGLLFQGNTGNSTGFGIYGIIGAYESDPEQLGYNPLTGESERIVFDLGVDSVSATFKVEAFYSNGNEKKRGVWKIFDDGVEVASGQFDA